MNPALKSKWQYDHQGIKSRVQIVGIWGTGARDTYKVISYELKHDNKQEIDLVSARKIRSMIKDGKLTYLAPGPDVPDSGFKRESATLPSPILRPEPNNRLKTSGQTAKERRLKSDAGAALNTIQMEF